jgi:hypothetical protein
MPRSRSRNDALDRKTKPSVQRASESQSRLTLLAREARIAGAEQRLESFGDPLRHRLDELGRGPPG